MNRSIPKNHTHAIVYRGAPYGSNEGGEILMTRPSLASALCEMGKLQLQPRYYANVMCIDLDESDEKCKESPRSYFA